MNEQEKIPISYFINLILPYKFFIAGSLVVFLGLAWVYLQTQPNNYRAKATMLLSQDKGGGGSIDDGFLGTEGGFNPYGGREDEIGYMESYTFIRKAVLRMDIGISYFQKKWIAQLPKARKLNPYHILVDSTHNQLVKIPIHVSPAGSDKVTVRIDAGSAWIYDLSSFELADQMSDIYLEKTIRSGEFIETPYLKFQVIVNDKFPFNTDLEYFFVINALPDLVERYQAKLHIKPESSESNILGLSSSGPLISLEEEFLNLVMDTYIKDKLDRKSSTGRNTMAFINMQIKQTADSLRAKEKALTLYKTSKGALGLNTSGTLQSAELTRLMTERSDLQVKLQFVKYIQESLATSDISQLPSPSSNELPDPLLRTLILSLSNLNQELAEIGFNQTENSPKYRSKLREIENTKASLVENVKSNISTLEISLRNVNGRIGRITGDISALPQVEEEINKMERDVLMIKNQYEYLLKKKADAGLIITSQEEDNLILDEARPESTSPVSPNRMLIFGLAFILGIGLPIGFVVLKELFQTKVTGQRDLDLMTDIPTLGFIIHNDSSSLRITNETQNTAFAECFRSLRVQVKYFGNKGTKQLVGFTSTWPNEGKSFCAANYAAVMALSGKKTLLVDLDLRSPSLQDYYLFGKGHGLTEYLQGSVNDWRDLLRNSDIDTLKLLPAGSITFKPLDLLEGERFANMLKEMRKEYDVIILDTPPIGQTADYNIVKEYLDFTSYVVRYKKTDKESLKQINMLYDTGIVTNIGLIINGVTEAFFNKYGDKGTYYGQYIGREYV
ncbi:MAG: polysaccharide biosynthesis tyrosine autokinase [Bacteroidetes bacterium]|nr:polysaccharide biosynthesis tyrosine autokinase [Bacteroidota bacterium]MCB0850907.1 polysaccharide biosynthesis tyrosine autokinase [Bacteroidota bacterium]